MNIFIKGDGKKIDLDLDLDSRVVAVQKTNPLFSYSHTYSILVTSKDSSYFLSSKNYSRRSWTGVDTALEYLRNLQDSYANSYICDDDGLLPEEDFKPIFVKENNLIGGDWKKIKRIWVKKYLPNETTHYLPYYYTQEQTILIAFTATVFNSKEE